jgi:hypothetical protein
MCADRACIVGKPEVMAPSDLQDYFRIARDPPETGGECPDWLLHCEDGAEPGRALDNALISLRSFGQRVGLDYRFNFSLGYVI